MISTATDRESVSERLLEESRPDMQSRHSHNVASGERVLTSLLGLALAGLGLKRRGVAGWLMAAAGGGLLARGAMTHCSVYDRLGVTEEDTGLRGTPLNRMLHVRRSITIRKSPEELYNFWRDVRNLPRFLEPTEDVVAVDDRVSQWRARLPVIGETTWESEVYEDVPNRLIAWRTLGKPAFAHQGVITFAAAPGELGTAVTLEMVYQLRGGAVTAGLGAMMGRSPTDYLARNLHRFKQLMELGEITTNKSPTCR